MAIIRNVQKKMTYFTELSEPQNKCFQILQKHGVDVFSVTVVGHNVQDSLESLLMLLETVVKKHFKKKEEILPM